MSLCLRGSRSLSILGPRYLSSQPPGAGDPCRPRFLLVQGFDMPKKFSGTNTQRGGGRGNMGVGGGGEGGGRGEGVRGGGEGEGSGTSRLDRGVSLCLRGSRSLSILGSSVAPAHIHPYRFIREAN